MNKQNLNYFSEGERKSVEKFVKSKTRFLTPILKVIDWMGLTPNILSLISLLVMAGFVYYAPVNMWYAAIFVVLHIIFDNLDGSMARYKGIS